MKTAWSSGWFTRSPQCPPAHTGLLLQALLLQGCSRLRQRLPLPMRVHTLGGNRAGSDPSPPSDQGGGSHCQLMCPYTHSRGSKDSSRVETTIAGVHIPVHIWEGKGQAQLCGTKPSGSTQVLTKVCTWCVLGG